MKEPTISTVLTQDTAMKAHQWVEVAEEGDTEVSMEATVRMGAGAAAEVEASVDVAAAADTIGDLIEVVEVDQEDEEAWGRFS